MEECVNCQKLQAELKEKEAECENLKSAFYDRVKVIEKLEAEIKRLKGLIQQSQKWLRDCNLNFEAKEIEPYPQTINNLCIQ